MHGMQGERGEKLEEIFEDEKILKEKIKEIKMYKYIGETSRSAYEHENSEL